MFRITNYPPCCAGAACRAALFCDVEIVRPRLVAAAGVTRPRSGPRRSRPPPNTQAEVLTRAGARRSRRGGVSEGLARGTAGHGRSRPTLDDADYAPGMPPRGVRSSCRFPTAHGGPRAPLMCGHTSRHARPLRRDYRPGRTRRTTHKKRVPDECAAGALAVLWSPARACGGGPHHQQADHQHRSGRGHRARLPVALPAGLIRSSGRSTAINHAVGNTGRSRSVPTWPATTDGRRRSGKSSWPARPGRTRCRAGTPGR